jgi:hypothetical protein
VTVGDPSTNGSGANGPPTADAPGDPAAVVLAELRSTPVNLHLLRGYGPLAAALVVAVLMVVLLPSVAPERIVERPVETGASTATTTTTAPAATPTAEEGP